MEIKISRFISYLLHPLLMPLYTFLLMFNLNIYFASVISFKGKLIILTIIFLFTFFLPGVFTFLLYKKKIITSLYLENRSDRNIPVFFTLIFYLGAYYTLKNTGIPAIYIILILAATLNIIIIFLINLKYKISIHSLSIGALTGIFIGISICFNLELFAIIFILILLSGIVGYSRITLKAHKPSEVYTGYLIGFFSMFSVFIFILCF